MPLVRHERLETLDWYIAVLKRLAAFETLDSTPKLCIGERACLDVNWVIYRRLRVRNKGYMTDFPLHVFQMPCECVCTLICKNKFACR